VILPKDTQAAIAPNPERAVMRDQNRIDLRSAQSVNNRISCDAQVAKTVDTLVCCRPNIAFTVLEEFEYMSLDKPSALRKCSTLSR
jgi:hypothetical protein